MKNLKAKPKQPLEIKTPEAFRQLMGADDAGCIHTPADIPGHGNGYLEVTSLEKIRTAVKDPQLPLGRRNFFSVVLLTGGTATERIGFRQYHFTSNTIYFIPENHLHAIDHWSKDIKGFHAIFDADYFLLCLRNQVKLRDYPFFQPDKPPFLKLTATETSMMAELFKKMHFEYSRRRNANDDLLVRLYLNVLFIEIERIYRRKQDTREVSFSRRQQLVTGFKRLVTEHFMEKRQPAEYAALLYVTPNYLNDTVKEFTGKSAGAHIYEQLIAEAKARLIQTEQTVAQIAADLSFTDQSYFCRFFRKHTGFAPARYRQHHDHGKAV